MKIFKESLPEGFDSPTALPKNEQQALAWQKANKAWWESHPMRYDWKQPLPLKGFSKEFFLEVDRRFFSSAAQYMRWTKLPFDNLINFDVLRSMDVLEIGTGCGTHAQLIAQHARSFVGIDITDFAVEATSERMRCFGLNATIKKMDAESMEFRDGSFDFVWSWGVIHHSSNPRKVLEEIHRVLRPGGRTIIMVYHRSFWDYYVKSALFLGILQGYFLKYKTVHELVQIRSDGAIARFYSIREWGSICSDLFIIEEIEVFGNKGDMVPLPAGKVKDFISSLIPNRVGRFLTSTLKWGTLLVSKMKKPAN